MQEVNGLINEGEFIWQYAFCFTESVTDQKLYFLR